MECNKGNNVEAMKSTSYSKDDNPTQPSAKVEPVNFDDIRQSVGAAEPVNHVWCVQPITAIAPIDYAVAEEGEAAEMEILPTAPDELKPHVGKEFVSEEAATEFYYAYGLVCGFSIRRNQIRKSERTGEVIFRVLSCSKEGKREKKESSDSSIRKRASKPVTRVGCPATVHVRRRSENKWVVTKFVEKHTHKLMTPKSHFLPAHRNVLGNDGIQSVTVVEAVNFNEIIQAVPTAKSADSPGPPGYAPPIASVSPVTCTVVEGGGDEKEFIPVAPDDLKPHLGKEFKSEEAATEFYSAYGKICGFSIRRNQIRKSERTGQVVFRVLSCSREGKRGKKHTENVLRKRAPKPVTRVGCPAKVHIKRKAESKWVVTKFVEKHSHKLTMPIKSHLQKLHKNVLHEDLNSIAGLNDFTQALDFPANESGGLDKVACLVRYAKNTLRKKRLRSYDKDAHAIYDYFKQTQSDDPSFYYQVQVDDKCRVTSCFWVDGSSQLDYQAFGDVIYFDIAFKSTEYKFSFAPFIGVDHHKQVVLFGAGLLFGETIENFKWLFQTWLKAKAGKHPGSILTDQNPVIKAAVEDVFPNTQHRYFMWRGLQKLPQMLGHLYYEGSTFKHEFDKCVDQTETVEEFEARWQKIMKEYGLEAVEWLQQMYNVRNMWVPVYLRNVFLAGISTTCQNESINSLFNEYVNHHSAPVELIVGYQKALCEQRRKELETEAQIAYDLPAPRTSFPMETDLGNIYTREIFLRVQEELFQSPPYNANLVGKNGLVSMYKVSHMSIKRKVYNVEFNEEQQTATCTCLLFEHEGIVCRHSLAVFRTLCIDKMPAQYILKRWSQHAKVGLLNVTHNPQSMTIGEVSAFVQRDDLSVCWKNFSNAALKSLRFYDYAKEQIVKLIEEMEEINKLEPISLGQNVNTVDKLGSNEPVGLELVGTSGRSGLALSPNSNILHDPNIVQTKDNDPNKRTKIDVDMAANYTRMCHTCWGHDHDSQICPLLLDRGRGGPL